MTRFRFPIAEGWAMTEGGAGGVVTTLDGGDPSMGGFIVASGSEELHRSALASMTAGRDRGLNPA